MNVKTITFFYLFITSSAAETMRKQGTPDGSLSAMGLERTLNNNGRSEFLDLLRSCFKRSRRRPSYLTDLGYGSRVLTSSSFVRALLAYYDLFGVHGPGRKK